MSGIVVVRPCVSWSPRGIHTNLRGDEKGSPRVRDGVGYPLLELVLDRRIESEDPSLVLVGPQTRGLSVRSGKDDQTQRIP